MKINDFTINKICNSITLSIQLFFLLIGIICYIFSWWLTITNVFDGTFAGIFIGTFISVLLISVGLIALILILDKYM